VRYMKQTLIVLAALALAACGGTQADTTTFWDELPIDGETLQGIIDQDTADANCDGLQETFDTWDASAIDAGVKADLLTYIDTAMKDAGCY